MHADFFLRRAVEWAAIADAIRVAYPTGTGSFHWTVTGLYREAAWCHLLVRAGRYGAAAARLQKIYGKLFGDRIPCAEPTDSDGAEVSAVATEFFRRFRSAAVKRYAAAFGSCPFCHSV
jgi:hypothetical protein